MALTVEQLQQTLAGRPFRFYESVGSTNDMAIAWLRQDGPTGAVVIADEQTQGRGRLQRAWQTPPHSAVAMSVLLHPPAPQLPLVMMLGGWAVAKALDNWGVADVAIKWPNDVQIAAKKVCGVLPEVVWEGNRLLGVVLGIGINVRVDFKGTPLADTAISLESVLSRPIERAQLIRDVLAQVDSGYNTLIYAPQQLVNGWRARLNMIGKDVEIRLGAGQRIAGRVVAVDDEGALQLQRADGVIQRVLFGDVSDV